MPRFRAFVQKRLARETSGRDGFVVRRRGPSVDRAPKSSEKKVKGVRKPRASRKEKAEVKKEEKKAFESSTSSERVAEATTIVHKTSEAPEGRDDNFYSNVKISVDTATISNGEGRDDDLAASAAPSELREKADVDDDISLSNTQEQRSIISGDETSPKSNTQDKEFIGSDNDGASTELHDDETTDMTVQDTPSSSFMLESNLAILRSKDDSRKAESRNREDVTIASHSVASVFSDGSDLSGLERFLNVFRCIPEESEDEGDEPSIAASDDKNSSDPIFPRRYVMTGDQTSKSEEGIDVSDHIRNEDPISSDVHEAISSAMSSPSRRSSRSYRFQSFSNDQEVDRVIEIVTETHIDESKLEGGDLPGDQHDSWQPQEVAPKSGFDPKTHFAFPPVTLPLHNFAHLSGREAPVILLDEETMLPDNLPPMARLRFCNHVGGRYSLLVNKERCYV
ncbi:MAG: hypothetical protein SGILL_004687 [Bacillariaceae sp.]